MQPIRVVPKTTLLLAVLASVAMTLAACSKQDSSGSSSGGDGGPAPTTPQLSAIGTLYEGAPEPATPPKGGKVKYGIDAEPEGLDPTKYAFSQAGHAVASAVFDPLATLDKDGKWVPYLAKSITPSNDHKDWTIELPPNVKFHDGTALDATALDTVMKAYQASAITGTPLKAFVESFEVKDSTHLVIHLKKKWVNFPVAFTTQLGYVPAPAMLTSTDPLAVKKPIGSGPFIFDSHEDKKFWEFKKNPNYRVPSLPYLDSIEFVPVDDHADRNKQLFNGDLDVIQTYGGPEVKELRANKGYKRVENQHGDKAFLVVNTTKPPFDNHNARKAAAYATNAKGWRDGPLDGVAQFANSPFGPGQPGYIENNGYPEFNLDEAKKYAELYEKETGKPIEFKIIAAIDITNVGIAQSFAADYAKAGMKVEVVQMPQINLLANVATGNYEMSEFRLFASPNPDADIWFYNSESIQQGVSLNFPRFANETIDKALVEAVSTDDPAVRDKAYGEINKVLAEEAPFLWLGIEQWVVASRPEVNGISGALNGSIPTIGPKTWIGELSVSK